MARSCGMYEENRTIDGGSVRRGVRPHKGQTPRPKMLQPLCFLFLLLQRAMSWFSPTSVKLKEWDLYARELVTRGHGHPLWGPEPSLESGEVQLGDVGYLRKGHFCFWFNCMRPQSDPRNSRGVPDGFEVFEPPDGRGPDSGVEVHNVVMPPHLHSGSTESWTISGGASAGNGAEVGTSMGGEIQYNCKEKTGALLLLKEPGHEKYLECETSIRTYMKQHIDNWYKYGRARGIDIRMHDILFVSGFVKTSAWAVGAFKHRSSSGTLRVNAGIFTPGPSASGGFAISMSACRNPEVYHRYGPDHRLLRWNEHGESRGSDQCIFLQYVSMAKYVHRIRATAGPHELPEADSDDIMEVDQIAFQSFTGGVETDEGPSDYPATVPHYV
ncbi:hypothetical protein C8Q80DRAFT_309616 [Daedaleopsis nitida]|nr:hypothetical protein C8Q80DRAFT_309616 [Daedaleopsis nitida]